MMSKLKTEGKKGVNLANTEDGEVYAFEMGQQKAQNPQAERVLQIVTLYLQVRYRRVTMNKNASLHPCKSSLTCSILLFFLNCQVYYSSFLFIF